MNEWTEQEEQQIIERAKTGDPEANYALSLWALRRGEEEPDEPRWNRLAAKCLVKAAQAGYGPAKEQMASLLKQSSPSAPAQRSAPPAASPATESDGDSGEDDGDAAPRRTAPVRRSAPSSARPAAAPRRAAPRRAAPRRQTVRDDEDEGFDVDEASWDDDGDDSEQDDAAPVRRGRRGGSAAAGLKSIFGGGNWGDDKWRRLEFICVAVCAVLLIVIAVMVISGKHGGDSENAGGGSAIPPAGEVASAGNNAAPAAGDYPDAATQTAIMAAELDIFPAPEDYVTEPTTGTVSVSSEYLRLRKGPNVTYDPIAQMPNGTIVSVFAKKNDWSLILYQSDSGPIYGWCSSEYVIITAGAAGTAVTDVPGTVEG